MTYATIKHDDVTELVPKGGGGKWEVQVADAPVLLHENPTKVRSEGRERVPGDLDRIELGRNRGLYAVAKRPNEAARVQISEANFLSELLSRVAAPLSTESTRTPTVATDDYEHAYGTGVDVNAATETVDIVAPDRADYAVIHADDADGAFHVEVSTLDGDGGTAITTRDDADDGNYAGDAATDVFVRVAVAAPYLRVSLIDDSGAANTLDYSVYVR